MDCGSTEVRMTIICQEYIIASQLKVAATKGNEKYLLKMGTEFYFEMKVQ